MGSRDRGARRAAVRVVHGSGRGLGREAVAAPRDVPERVERVALELRFLPFSRAERAHIYEFVGFTRIWNNKIKVE